MLKMISVIWEACKRSVTYWNISSYINISVIIISRDKFENIKEKTGAIKI